MSRRAVLLLVCVGLAFVAGYALALRIVKPVGAVKPREEVAAGEATKASAAGRLIGGPAVGQPSFTTSTAPNGTLLVGGIQAVAPVAPAETGGTSQPK